jgi:hypothetical protein
MVAFRELTRQTAATRGLLQGSCSGFAGMAQVNISAFPTLTRATWETPSLRHEATGEARQGWTLVLQLVIPLLMILLAGLASRLTQ